MSELVVLAERNLSRLNDAVKRPLYDRQRVGVGHVHLGAGAFLRAHIAVYTDAALASDGGDWGIAGVSLRRPDVRQQLQPQDCLYTVAVGATSEPTYQLVGAIKSIDTAPDDPEHVVRLIADPSVCIVSITVTEKGYGIVPDSGALDLADADISHDVENLDEPRSTLGFIVAGLRRRRDEAAPPITIISCDNLPSNGDRLRNAVLKFAGLADPGLAAWIDATTSFPCTMVDRIVPITTEEDRVSAAEATGLWDAAVVRTEPFSQWVIEDNFVSDRPGWEAAGALFVDDVAPYELAKLRFLNGSHSAVAYLGYLSGHEYVHEAMQNASIRQFVTNMMLTEVSPVTPAPRGMEHDRYIEVLLERLDNSFLADRTARIAMDGSQKLPQRILDPIRLQLKCGGSVRFLSLVVSAWMRYVLGFDELGKPIDVDDALASRFADIAARSNDAGELTRAFVGITEIFGTDLLQQPVFMQTVADGLRGLLEDGVLATVESCLESCD